MRSTVTSESGIFDYSSTSYQLPPSPTSWRNNLTSSVVETPRATSQSSRRQTPDVTVRNTPSPAESLSKSIYKHETENATSEPLYQHPNQLRTARRQISTSPPNEYENLTSFRSGGQLQGKVPITTESRSRKPLVVDEVETIETETRVECQVQRTNESEQTSSPARTVLTKPSPSPRSPSEDLISSKRVLLNDRPQYYESIETRGETSLPDRWFVILFL